MPSMISTFDDLIAELRATDGLIAKGKTGQNFYVKSKAFLHFHGRDANGGPYADVRDATDWERVPISTPEERQALVARVRAHLGNR